jgi:hypothetical protein
VGVDHQRSFPATAEGAVAFPPHMLPIARRAAKDSEIPLALAASIGYVGIVIY